MKQSLEAAQKLIAELTASKPDDRSNLSRRYAIAITEAEKLYAWIYAWLYDDGSEEQVQSGAAGN